MPARVARYSAAMSPSVPAASIGLGRALLVLGVAGVCAASATAVAEGATARRLDGARLVRISGLSGSIQNPCWSPDGGRLAITLWPRQYNEGTASVHVVPRTGGAPLAQVSDSGATSVNLPGTCWDRASDLITFSAEADAPDAVFAAGPAGDRRARIFGREGLVSIEPSWSPDGSRVVFESSVYDAEGAGTIWIVGADGSGLRQLTRGADDRQPNWSPAGDRIVFQRTRSGYQDLYTIRPDGSGLRNVTKTRRLSETDASWSPSGAQDRLLRRRPGDRRRGAVRDSRGRGQARARHPYPRLVRRRAGMVTRRQVDRVRGAARRSGRLIRHADLRRQGAARSRRRSAHARLLGAGAAGACSALTIRRSAASRTAWSSRIRRRWSPVARHETRRPASCVRTT